MDNSRLRTIGASGGILFVVLQVISQFLSLGSGGEPAFSAPGDEILQFFSTTDAQLAEVGAYLSTLAMLALIWFLGVLWRTLSLAEGEPAWLSIVVFGSGLLAIAAGLTTGFGWELALFRIAEGLDPQIARLHFDIGNYAFVTMWVGLASFLLATSAIILQTGVFARWLGWFALILALGLLVSRAFWAVSGVVFVPYILFWLWLIIVSIVLMRRKESTLAA